MRWSFLVCFLISSIALSAQSTGNTPFPSFSAPDKVCVYETVNIQNNSTNASSFFWNFCVADIDAVPQAQNLGNVGGYLSNPVFIDFVEVDGLFYAFSINFNPGGLVRHDFGNSLLNSPTSVYLGNFNGALLTGAGAEGIQIINNDNKWYAFVVGGYTKNGSVATEPRIVKLEFGSDITSTPTATNWGNIGGMDQPVDLHMFKEGNEWYGLTVSAENSTITRFAFGSNFDNVPTGTNLGDVGGLVYPTGIYAVNDDGFWRVFIPNAGSVTQYGDFSLSRLDFGNSLLNTPVGVNLGNPGNILRHPRDITIVKSCDKTLAFLVNGQPGSNDIVKLDFNNDLSSMPTFTSLGNLGNLNFPHSLSKIFRVDNDYYSFITNVSNHTITRVRFPGCSDAVLKSTSERDPQIIYPNPGIYNITLTIDEGLPTQQSVCRQIEVQAGPVVDFTFQQDVCDPSVVRFRNESFGYQDFEWDFGNGTVVQNQNEIEVDFVNFNTYDISLKATVPAGCDASVSKSVPVLLTPDSLIIGPADTLACLGNDLVLDALEAMRYCWQPAGGLSAASIRNPVINTVMPETEYDLNGLKTEANLVKNGDFSNGNMDFENTLTFNASNGYTQGTYTVSTQPNNWNNGFQTCGDRSTGSGNMLVVKGNVATEKEIWAQRVSLNSQTNYAFSTFMLPLSASSQPRLRFAIDGIPMGEEMIWTSAGCVWQRFDITWNSGVKTTARISIVSLNAGGNTNDFALDDIAFQAVNMLRDSILVTTAIKPEVDFSHDIVYCKTAEFLPSVLNAPEDILSWTWNFGDGLSAEAESVTHAYLAGGTYTVSVVASDAIGCTDTAFQEVILDTATAVVSAGTPGEVCIGTPVQLEAEGGSSVLWENNDLQEPENPLQTVAPEVSTRYFVTVTDDLNCTDTASVLVNVIPRPAFQRPSNQQVCMDSTVTLYGGNGPGYRFEWSPAAAFSNPAERNQVIAPLASSVYGVVITEPRCGYNEAFQVAVTVNPNPTVTASSSNDIDCRTTSTRLEATGSIGNVYEWLDSALVDQSTPGFTRGATAVDTFFRVKATNIYGCSSFDSVLVRVSVANEPQLRMPNGFTPNGDGHNDCYLLSTLGSIELTEFSVFTRWGEKVFSTNNPRDCWNGMFKGSPLPMGTYVYFMKGKNFCGEFFRKGTISLVR